MQALAAKKLRSDDELFLENGGSGFEYSKKYTEGPVVRNIEEYNHQLRQQIERDAETIRAKIERK